MTLDASLQNSLAVFYVLVAIMNFAFAAYYGLSRALERMGRSRLAFFDRRTQDGGNKPREQFATGLGS